MAVRAPELRLRGPLVILTGSHTKHLAIRPLSLAAWPFGSFWGHSNNLAWASLATLGHLGHSVIRSFVAHSGSFGLSQSHWVIIGERVRGRETEYTERPERPETERPIYLRQRQRETERQRQRDRQRQRQRDRHYKHYISLYIIYQYISYISVYIYIWQSISRDSIYHEKVYTERQRGREQAERQRGREQRGQRDREAERQRDRDRQTLRRSRRADATIGKRRLSWTAMAVPRRSGCWSSGISCLGSRSRPSMASRWKKRPYQWQANNERRTCDHPDSTSSGFARQGLDEDPVRPTCLLGFFCDLPRRARG
jgi:hypothetical protein